MASTMGVSCMDAIRSVLSPDEFAGYCKGSALRCLWNGNTEGMLVFGNMLAEYAASARNAEDTTEPEQKPKKSATRKPAQKKKCCECNEVRDLSEFAVDKRTDDGHSKRCKVCSKKASQITVKKKSEPYYAKQRRDDEETRYKQNFDAIRR